MLWLQGYIALAQDPHHFDHESSHARTHYINKDDYNTAKISYDQARDQFQVVLETWSICKSRITASCSNGHPH